MIWSAQLVMLPWSSEASSTTYRFQVPFGAIPSKVDRLTLPEGAGAGAGNGSPAPQLAGRKEPVVSCAASGSCVAASSSSVRLMPETGNEPPASDIGMMFVEAVGEASSTSMSSGNVCESPLITRLTSVIVPDRPLTTQVDG